MIFGLETNPQKMTINQALFLLNKNNYKDITNTRRYSCLYLSFSKAMKDKKDYVNEKNFSFEIKNILKNLKINEKELYVLDNYLMEEYFIKDIVFKDMIEEKDKYTLQKKYRSLFHKKKNKNKNLLY